MRLISDQVDNRVTGAAFYGARLKPFIIDIELQGQESKLAMGDGVMTAVHFPWRYPGSVVYNTDLDDQLVH